MHSFTSYHCQLQPIKSSEYDQLSSKVGSIEKQLVEVIGQCKSGNEIVEGKVQQVPHFTMIVCVVVLYDRA